MSTLALSVKVIESSSEIETRILEALLPDVTKFFTKVQNQLAQIIPNIIINSITNQPEYDSLLNGTLQYEFGLPDPASRLSEIISSIKDGSIVTVKPIVAKSSGISGGVKIQMIKKDFGDLLSLGGSSFVTEKGDRLDWLKWLLIEGDSVIVSDHIFIFGPSQYSRTGYGIMRQVGGGFWRVPPEYAGTINNNWITRAIESASSEIESQLQKLLEI